MSEEAMTSFVDNSAANETTPNASENNVVSFVDNSTQVEKIANGTKVTELEHVADGLMKETMEKITRIKEEDFAEKSTQNLPLFLAENEKNVKIENKVLEFLNDATVNITVENNQLILYVKDDKILSDEKILYFCFKSTVQSYVSSICPSGFCEVQLEFSTSGRKHSTHIEFDKHNQTFGGNFITAMISEKSMKVTNIPNLLAPVTTCNPNVSQGYWTVKVINKGDKVVKL
uniref:Uncharacterized protein n=1 Tax=Panagrolaimus sp. JU765 TaxID=591449 RepID=A0AC34Q7X7_9BILA